MSKEEQMQNVDSKEGLGNYGKCKQFGLTGALENKEWGEMKHTFIGLMTHLSSDMSF